MTAVDRLRQMARLPAGRSAGGRLTVASLAARHRGRLPAVIGFGLLSSLLEGVGIGLLIPLLAIMAGTGAGVGAAMTGGAFAPVGRWIGGLPASEQVMLLGGAILALFAIKGWVVTIHGRKAARLEGAIGHDVRCALASQVLEADFRTILAADEQHLIHVISADVWEVSGAVRLGIALLTAGCALGVFVVLLALVEWRMLLMVAVVGLLVVAWLRPRNRAMRTLGQRVQATNEDLAIRMVTVVLAARVIRLFGREKDEERRFAERSDDVRLAQERLLGASEPLVPQIEMVLAGVFVMLLVFAQGIGVPLAVAVTFLVLVSRAQPHLQALAQSWLGIATRASSIREVDAMLAMPSTRAIDLGSAGRQPLAAIDADIRLENVSFAYPDGTTALSEVNLVIPDGSITALIGPSGAGKSTLVNLVCRLVEPDSGDLLLGSTPIRRFGVADWRSRVALAGQDAGLIYGTVRENLLLGRPDATDSEIRTALADARADAFVAALPAGLDTMLVAEGGGMSGGQRQRLGLARAMLRGADLLILDEAMNAVDGLTEDEVIAILSERRHFRTCLVISHRRSTLAHCDHGIVLEGGRCTASGPLATLGYYGAMAGGEG